jgi:hypothetical protein
MALPTSDGKATDFNMIPGYTSLWPSGNGTVSPFNTPGTAGLAQTYTVKAPEAPATDPGESVKRRSRKTSTRKSN